jgi:hypothetical protein
MLGRPQTCANLQTEPNRDSNACALVSRLRDQFWFNWGHGRVELSRGIRELEVEVSRGYPHDDLEFAQIKFALSQFVS